MDVSVTKEGEESNLPKSLLELNTLVSQGKAYQIDCTNIIVESQGYSIWDGTIDKGQEINPDNVEGFVSTSILDPKSQIIIFNGPVKPAPTYGTIDGYSSYWCIFQGIQINAPTYYVVLKEAV